MSSAAAAGSDTLMTPRGTAGSCGGAGNRQVRVRLQAGGGINSACALFKPACDGKRDRQNRFSARGTRVKGPLSQVWVRQWAGSTAALHRIRSSAVVCHMYFFYYSVKGNKIYRTKLFLF